MAGLRLANGGVAGIDSFRCGDRARATLMDDEARLRTVPPKDLNGRCAAASLFRLC